MFHSIKKLFSNTFKLYNREHNGHYVHQRRRLSQMLSQASIDAANVNPSGSNRRRLPRTPESLSTGTNQGEILLQVSLDTDHNQLTVGVICAKRVSGVKYASYAQVQILPAL